MDTLITTPRAQSPSTPAGSTSSPVVVQIVSFNQASLLPFCLKAIEAQTYRSLSVLVTDNASEDGSPDLIQRDFPQVILRKNRRNVGFGAAHNAMLREHQAPFILILNVDVRLAPTYVEELVRFLEGRANVGMAQGKLLQWDGNPRGQIDAIGIRLHRNRRNELLGYGEADRGQYDRPMEIFGCDGAAALYRRAMLDDIRCEGEVFDESFFLWREDVDLSWRARWRGWKAWYVPTAVAWHVRRYKPGSRRQQAPWLRRLQLRNRYLMLLKNESLKSVIHDLGPILWFELRALLYTVLVEPHYCRAYAGVFRLLPQAIRKRRVIVSRRQIPDEAMRRWFCKSHPSLMPVKKDLLRQP